MNVDMKFTGPQKEAMLDFIFCFSQGKNLIRTNGIDFFYCDFLNSEYQDKLRWLAE